MWVAPSKSRAKVRKTIKSVYGIARPITQRGRGSEPWTFLVDADPPNAKTMRLRKSLGVSAKEDVWIELALYPNEVAMKKTSDRYGVIQVWRELLRVSIGSYPKEREAMTRH